MVLPLHGENTSTFGNSQLLRTYFQTWKCYHVDALRQKISLWQHSARGASQLRSQLRQRQRAESSQSSKESAVTTCRSVDVGTSTADDEIVGRTGSAGAGAGREVDAGAGGILPPPPPPISLSLPRPQSKSVAVGTENSSIIGVFEGVAGNHKDPLNPLLRDSVLSMQADQLVEARRRRLAAEEKSLHDSQKGLLLAQEDLFFRAQAILGAELEGILGDDLKKSVVEGINGRTTGARGSTRTTGGGTNAMVAEVGLAAAEKIGRCASEGGCVLLGASSSSSSGGMTAASFLSSSSSTSAPQALHTSFPRSAVQFAERPATAYYREHLEKHSHNVYRKTDATLRSLTASLKQRTKERDALSEHCRELQTQLEDLGRANRAELLKLKFSLTCDQKSFQEQQARLVSEHQNELEKLKTGLAAEKREFLSTQKKVEEQLARDIEQRLTNLKQACKAELISAQDAVVRDKVSFQKRGDERQAQGREELRKEKEGRVAAERRVEERERELTEVKVG